MASAARSSARPAAREESAGLTPRRRIVATVILIVGLCTVWEATT